ncbi:hypothetical protein JCM10207_006827 [Rhodosporidiobolus poonsookiae]
MSAYPRLPPELIRETICLSLLPSSPSPSLSAGSSGASTPLISYASTPGTPASGPATESDPFAASFSSSLASSSPTPTPTPTSKRALLRSYSLTSPLFRAVSQPLLFRTPALPDLKSALAFLAAVEADADLAAQVRRVTIGALDEEEGEGEGLTGPALDAKLVLGRLASACPGIREVRLSGCGRVRVEELLGLKELRKLSLSSCLLAPSVSYAPDAAFHKLTHFTLASCHLTTHALPGALFPSLTRFALTTPRDSIASSPGQLGDFLGSVAPTLRSFSLNDPASGLLGGGIAPGLGLGEAFNPLLDALPSFSSALTHFETTNAHPFAHLPFLPADARRALDTLALDLAGPLSSGHLRWAPLADSLCRDTLQLLRVVLTAPPPHPSSLAAAAAEDALPAWVHDLASVRRVVLPSRVFEAGTGLSAMVQELRDALAAVGRDVEVVPQPEGGFWAEVERRQQQERDEQRRAASAW